MSAARRTLLLTGFEPFDGEAINPCWEVAHAPDGQRIGGWRVAAVQLPCVFGASRAALDAALRRLRRRPHVPAGFIHLPPLPAQAARHAAAQAMPLAEQVQGIGLAIALVAAGTAELHAAGGTLS